jgi:multiple sugar transport system ATP-binding protein
VAEIVLDQVTKRFPDGALAVDKISLDIADGEFVILVGPSGCGKSTTLNMIAGLEDITEGELRIGGQVVNNKAPKDRDIAMVFQSYALYPHMTVRQNMGFALKLAKTPQATIDEKVNEAARILDLTQHLERRPANLSGGQRQRVAMGRAIVRDPSAFLMDEPLSNLDAKLRVQTRSQIAELQRRLGITTVYVTHDQIEAMTMGHRVAVLRDGRLQQCATPRELYDNPVNEFVAGFIGSPAMNLRTVPLADGAARLANTLFPLPPAVRTAAKEAGLSEIVLGIRPEHLHPANGSEALADQKHARAADGSAALTGEVMLVEELGADALLHVRLPDGGNPVVARAEGRKPPTPGRQVTFHVQPDDIFAFHPQTGARLAG